MFTSLLEHIKFIELSSEILEMYKRVETDSEFTLTNNAKSTPAATLADEYGGRAQIAIDDGCYVLYLKQPDGRYKRTAWIFPEAHEALKDLPSPEEVLGMRT